MAKGKGLKVTCDVAVYTLFFDKEQYPEATCLPTKEDQRALWEHLSVIDTFSVGSVPHQLGLDLGKTVSAASGIEETLPLLLSAVADGRLSLDDITARLYENPIEIFGLPEQPQTYVEVEVARQSVFNPSSAVWSPLDGKDVAGGVHRVVAYGTTVYLDGFTNALPLGRDISGSLSGVSKHARRDSVSRPNRQSFSQTQTSPMFGARSAGKELAQPNLLSLAATAVSTQPTVRDVSPPRAFSSLVAHPSFSRRHILAVKQFDREDLHYLFSVASEMRLQVERNGSIDTLRGKVLATMFYEPSTRTSTSFEAAMKRCGGEVVAVTADRSSVTKGESLSDTIKTLGCYSDAIVIRHPAVGSAKAAAKASPVPVFNAGDGIGEHPTQSLLDVYTIREELGSVNGITITLVGDLKNGRTVHSLCKLLSLYTVTLNFVSPPTLAMPEYVKADLSKAGIPWAEYASLDPVIAKSDVLYVTRVQK